MFCVCLHIYLHTHIHLSSFINIRKYFMFSRIWVIIILSTEQSFPVSVLIFSSCVPFNFIFPSYSCAKYVLRCILVSAIWIQSFKCICFEIYIYTKYEASIIYSHFSGYFIGWDLPCLIQPPAVCSYFNVNDLKRNKM